MLWGLSTRPGQYQLDFLWTLVENEPEPTGSIQAEEPQSGFIVSSRPVSLIPP